MKLPNANLAIIERKKLVEYLLNVAHPDNGGKAAFFLRIGFLPDRWRVLAAALKSLAETGEVVREVTSAHGRKYVVDGSITSPQAGQRTCRSVWIVDEDGAPGPRLVTAYPL